MNLAQIHIDIIREGLVKRSCYECYLAETCLDPKYKTYCREIKDWLDEQESKLIDLK